MLRGSSNRAVSYQCGSFQFRQLWQRCSLHCALTMWRANAFSRPLETPSCSARGQQAGGHPHLALQAHPSHEYLPRCAPLLFFRWHAARCQQSATPPPARLITGLLPLLHTEQLCCYYNTLAHTPANAWPSIHAPPHPTSHYAVCVIVGEFASTSQLVKAGASGSVNVSVWGTPDRRAGAVHLLIKPPSCKVGVQPASRGNLQRPVNCAPIGKRRARMPSHP